MGRKRRKRQREGAGARPAAGTDYEDAQGNVLTLRDHISDATLQELERQGATAATSAEDRWARRGEFLFERLAVSWTIAGLPLTGQKELLGRYRMASAAERDWVRGRIEEHLERLGVTG